MMLQGHVEQVKKRITRNLTHTEHMLFCISTSQVLQKEEDRENYVICRLSSLPPKLGCWPNLILELCLLLVNTTGFLSKNKRTASP